MVLSSYSHVFWCRHILIKPTCEQFTFLNGNSFFIENTLSSFICCKAKLILQIRLIWEKINCKGCRGRLAQLTSIVIFFTSTDHGLNLDVCQNFMWGIFSINAQPRILEISLRSLYLENQKRKKIVLTNSTDWKGT